MKEYFLRMRKIPLFIAAIIFFIAFASFINPVFSRLATDSNTAIYPFPAKTNKLLFYIQRSHNKNTIAYELNLDKNGKLKNDRPIHPYWICYNQGDALEELSYIQQKFAYGLNVKSLDAENKSYKFNFVSYSKKSLYLRKREGDDRYVVTISVNDKEIELDKIYVKTDGGTFWVPVIKYIEVSGNDISTGKYINERIIP